MSAASPGVRGAAHPGIAIPVLLASRHNGPAEMAGRGDLSRRAGRFGIVIRGWSARRTPGEAGEAGEADGSLRIAWITEDDWAPEPAIAAP